MKKNNILTPILFAIAVSIFSVFAFATEPVNTSIETAEDYISQAPWKYGEMKDGLFVRDMNEELSWISPDDANYLAEMEICIESHKLEKLTPEMEALGYKLDYDGYVISPVGEPSEAEGSTKVQGSRAEEDMKLSGQVTFHGTIDSDISETCFIEVKNTTTGKTYIVELYNVNQYTRTVYFPEGEYIPLAGGIYNDFTGKYPFSSEGFTVKNGSFSYIEVKIGQTNSEKEVYVETEVIEEPQEEQPIVPEKNTKSTWQSLLLSVIFPIILIVLGYFGLKRFKQWRDNRDE